MTKMKQSFSSWAITVPLILVAVLFFWFVHRPAENEIEAIRTEIQMKREFILSTNSTHLVLEEKRRELDATGQFIEAWHDEVPDESGSAEVFREINGLLRRSHVTTRSFEPTESDPMESISRFPLTLAVSGSFSQVFEMLVGLEQIPGTVWVENLRLASNGKDGRSIVGSADLVIFGDKSRNSD